MIASKKKDVTKTKKKIKLVGAGYEEIKKYLLTKNNKKEIEFKKLSEVNKQIAQYENQKQKQKQNQNSFFKNKKTWYGTKKTLSNSIKNSIKNKLYVPNLINQIENKKTKTLFIFKFETLTLGEIIANQTNHQFSHTISSYFTSIQLQKVSDMFKKIQTYKNNIIIILFNNSYDKIIKRFQLPSPYYPISIPLENELLFLTQIHNKFKQIYFFNNQNIENKNKNDNITLIVVDNYDNIDAMYSTI